MYPHEQERLDQLCDVCRITDENKQVNTEQQAEGSGKRGGENVYNAQKIPLHSKRSSY